MTGLPGSSAIPVLAFHAVGNGRGPLWTPIETFTAMIDAALAAGFTPVCAHTVATMVRESSTDVSKSTLMGKPIAITFDDGYANVLEHALPVLADRKVPATVFAVTGAVNGVNDWDPPGQFGGGLRLLDRSGLATLADAGWEIGLHTHTHPHLRNIAADATATELDSGQEVLASLGLNATTMAYPYGDSDEVSRSVVRGRFVGGFGIGAGFASAANDPALIERIESWYLRHPALVSRLHRPSGRAYMALRRELRTVGKWVGGRRG